DLGDEESTLAPEGTPAHSVPDVAPMRKKRAMLMPDLDDPKPKEEAGSDSGRRGGKVPALGSDSGRGPRPKDAAPLAGGDSARRSRPAREEAPGGDSVRNRAKFPREEAPSGGDSFHRAKREEAPSGG